MRLTGLHKLHPCTDTPRLARSVQIQSFNYSVVYPDVSLHEQAGYGLIAQAPHILDSELAIHSDGSLYLVDRALGLWAPGRSTGVEGKGPAAQSMDTYAHWLAGFLEWADVRSVDLFTTGYALCVARYETELQKGIWSKNGEAHEQSTTNFYVDVAIDFLRWLTVKGRRPHLDVPVMSRQIRLPSVTSSVGHRARATLVRRGRRRAKPRRLAMPTDRKVREWLQSMYEQTFSYGLACETILMTAVRRSEVGGWRVDTLPLEPAEWVILNPTAAESDQEVLVTIKFGTKGPDYGFDHGDKVGPDRDISIPLHLARKMHDYRQHKRPAALKIWVRGAKGLSAQMKRKEESVHLFRNADGSRMTGRRLYDACKRGSLPYEAWSLHLGRHWWACSTLWQHYKRHIAAVEAMGRKAPQSALITFALDVIRLYIQPQLGHAQDNTSMIYLHWFAAMTSISLSELFVLKAFGDED